MRERGHVPQVGAQDLELRNSPVVQEVNEDMDAVTLDVSERSVCYFNARPTRTAHSCAAEASCCAASAVCGFPRGAVIPIIPDITAPA